MASSSIITSPDGINWTDQQVDKGMLTRVCVTYGNGLFVVIGCPPSGQGIIMTSPDGINWTERIRSDIINEWTGVTYGNGLFVAIGGYANHQIITSAPLVLQNPSAAL